MMFKMTRLPSVGINESLEGTFNSASIVLGFTYAFYNNSAEAVCNKDNWSPFSLPDSG
jgi:hypothetical protein